MPTDPRTPPGSTAPGPAPQSLGLRLLTAAVLTGLLAGLFGMLLALLLHAIQHLAYGYSLDQLHSHESFLQGVSAAPGWRRVAAMALCGLVAGLGWWWLQRQARLPAISQALQGAETRLPPARTTAHAVLQIATVALGSPLGREVAPREMGALSAGWTAHWLRLPTDQARMLVACGAGAGLAAVYNVPLAGALFVLEVLLAQMGWQAAVLALLTSALATGVAQLGLGDVLQYQLPPLTASPSLLAWALVCGPLLGLAAQGFTRITTWARAAAPRNARLIPQCLLAFTAMGLLAVALPQLLGNGKGAAQLGFANELGLQLAAVLLVCKLLVTVLALRSGAHGGLLTPGLAIGALLAVLLGGGWSLLWPGPSSGAYALVGGAAFLAVSMRMPFTAIVLLMEMTAFSHTLLMPLGLAVAGATAAGRWAAGRF